jgi:hypothetical protein
MDRIGQEKTNSWESEIEASGPQLLAASGHSQLREPIGRDGAAARGEQPEPAAVGFQLAAASS